MIKIKHGPFKKEFLLPMNVHYLIVIVLIHINIVVKYIQYVGYLMYISKLQEKLKLYPKNTVMNKLDLSISLKLAVRELPDLLQIGSGR